MAEFIEADPPCFALGLVEVGGTRCAMLGPGATVRRRRNSSISADAIRGHGVDGYDKWL